MRASFLEHRLLDINGLVLEVEIVLTLCVAIGFRASGVQLVGELIALLLPVVGVELAVLVVAAHPHKPVLGLLHLVEGPLEERPLL